MEAASIADDCHFNHPTSGRDHRGRKILLAVGLGSVVEHLFLEFILIVSSVYEIINAKKNWEGKG